jgi:uncharacterized lipoprotein YddW (UPF0748 family)
MHQILTFSLILSLFVSNVSAQDSPKRELRAAWIATVEYIDWPAKPGMTAQEQQESYVTLLDQLKSAGMNAVIVQVRPTADTFYPSSYEPWSTYLTGKQGQAPQPYYNPLAFMIEEAKKRGLEFHAWFNPYRASMKNDFIPSADHPLIDQREWFVQYGGKWYYDPGIPEAREFVLQSILETVRHYDLDAVHFDDYFYPYRVANEEFPDNGSYARYGKARFKDINEWRRHNVDWFVEELSRRIKAEKPFVKFGISPFGVWRNKDKDPMGSDTRAGVTNYDDLHADVLKWLREGWIDYITPQLYWHIGFELAEYKTLVQWWSRHTFGKHLYIGQGIYRIGEKGWEDENEIVNQIRYNREFPEVKGSMHFSSKIIAQNKLGINEKLAEAYPHPALVPTMPWLDPTAPPAPRLTQLSGNQGEGIQLAWEDGSPDDQAYYVIYRSSGGEPIDIDNPQHILAIVQRQPQSVQEWTDQSVEKRTRYTYYLTAVDRLHNESVPSLEITARTRGKNGSIRIQ